MKFNSEVFFITGGARGQGRAIALKAASLGARISLVDVCEDKDVLPYELGTQDDLKETQRLVEELGAECLISVGDVRSQSDMDNAVAETIARFGSVDVLCANAGVHSFIPFWEMSEEQWDVVVDTNLKGVWHATKAVAPSMIERQRGALVFTSSTMAREGGPDLGHYAASKAGVLGFMRSAAFELGAHGVRCNAVLPSTVHSAMGENPQTRKWIFRRDDATTADYIEATKHWHLMPGRPGLPPSSIADAVVWLASNEARHITGVELAVDAGHLVLPGFNHEIRDVEDEPIGPWY